MSPFRGLDRPRFFSGQHLTADDLAREQDYVRDRLRRHNRLLHGWGIVAGLDVSLDGGEVVVAPGLAIDCAGNEIVVEEPVRLPLAGRTGPLSVVVRYVEVELDPVPVSPDGRTEPSRVRESAAVELVAANPNAGHGGMYPGTPGCGRPHAVFVAALSEKAGTWRLTPAKRPKRR